MELQTSSLPAFAYDNSIKIEFDKSEHLRKARLLRTLCLISTISHVLAAPVSYIWLGLMLQGFWLVFILIFWALSLCSFLLGYRLAASKHYGAISWLILLTILANVMYFWWVLGTGVALGLLLVLPMTIALMLLGFRGITILAIISLASSAVLYVSQDFLKTYTPFLTLSKEMGAVINLLCIFMGIPILVLILFVSTRSQLHIMLAQNNRLSVILTELETRQRNAQQFSQQVLALTTQLNVTASQQAAGIQEQVAAINQVTASLEELNESAIQISTSAVSASQAANHTVEVTTEVREANALVQTTVSQGTLAVDHTIASVAQVRNRIELLGQRLLHLTEQNRQVSSVIDLIEDVADETQLLALNASIEAAGSIEGDQSGRSNTRNDRFGVIALEVKNLSDRSREATEEVRQTIVEMQGAVASAVLVAEEGKKETTSALSRAQLGGAVIDKLSAVICTSVAQAEQILRSVEEVNVRCDEISVATGQQRTANQQILSTMRVIADVSQDNARMISQLSEMAQHVNYQVTELNQAFVQPGSELATALPT
jgi:methyl-accepting chemotaxis protein